MKTITQILLISMLSIAWSCGGGQSKIDQIKSQTITEVPKASPKGIGEIKEVNLTDPLEQGMVTSGKAIYDMKCSACHRLASQRVVGPGFEGVTNRRRPEWIMNMITNVDVMLDKDPQAQALLEECLTRMPNQNVTVVDARSILEFLRSNDQERIGQKDQALTK